MKTAIAILVIAILSVSAIAIQHYQHVDKYSVATAAPLPDLLQDWTDEQLEDEQITYLEAIETLKDEQKRRAK